MAPIIPNWDDISQDSLTKFIDKYWSPYKTTNEAFDPNIIDTVYYKELKQNNFLNKKITILEFSQYLENYLIPNLVATTASLPHIMSIVIMINQKIKEGVPGLKTFDEKSDLFPPFFHKFLTLILQQKLNLYEKTQAIIFLNHAFNSLELFFVRKCVQKLVSLSTWCCLYENRRESEFKEMPKLKKIYNALMKKEAKMDEGDKERAKFERTFLYKLLQDFINLINDLDKTDTQSKQSTLNRAASITYCERFLEFLIDLEAHLPNRRFFKVILDSTHLLTYCTLCSLNKADDEQTKLFSQQLEILKFYHGFEINDLTGEALTEGEMTDIHYEQIISLQKSCFKNYRNSMLKFALANVASIDTRDQLIKSFSSIDNKTLYQIGASLALLPSDLSTGQCNEDSSLSLTKSSEDSRFLIELLVSRHERRLSQLDAINDMPLYPTEDVLWDENLVPSEYYNGQACLALPKLNLQFLTLHDYLLRNFTLFKLETTFEIRKDIEDAITRMKPWRSEDGRSCLFGGWARMALAITSFTIMDVGKPALGERRPSRVRAEVTVNLNVTDEIKEEWQALRRHDICFLICVRPERSFGTQHDRKKAFKSQVGLTYVRGCEIEGMLDVDGKLVEEGPKAKEHKLPQGAVRSWRVWLDTNQYAIDMATGSTKSAVASSAGEIPFLEAYDGFNVLLRRKPKENNFKAVLETIRDIMNVPPKWARPEAQSPGVGEGRDDADRVTGDAAVLPAWLHDLMLGYGEPDSASYTHVLPDLVKVQPNLGGLDVEGYLDFRDTFLDRDHVIQCFPEYSITHLPLERSPQSQQGVTPFYKLKFSDLPGASDVVTSGSKMIEVKEYQVETIGPYQRPTNVKRNLVRFTPTQAAAIKSGILPGLTMVVGPPGTGKTDLAVQIVSTLYHAHPLQRTLLVTHSNQALNQLFEKISRLDIDERHLLRLGHGEEGLDLEGKDFSKYGRVDFVLSRRLSLLSRVRSLQLSLLDPSAEQEAALKSQSVTTQVLTKRQREAMAEEEENMELVNSSIPDPSNLPENYEEMEQEEEAEEVPIPRDSDPRDTALREETRNLDPRDTAPEGEARDLGPGHTTREGEEIPIAFKDTDPTPLNRESIILSAHRVQNPFATGGQAAPSLGASYFATADVSYTCETALYFYRYEVLSRWEKFKIETSRTTSDTNEIDDERMNARIVEKFPFTRFFQDLGRPLFDTSAPYTQNMAVAESCFKYIKNIFDQLEEFRAFELLRNGTDRVKYLLIREAKIIAMTCTHAALRRGDLIAAGFKYDNILIEEAAQILEIESFIPLLLQNNEDGVNRLKRWIMIGDHNQLPPVIKNMAFKKYSNMEQSMFTRFIRLGVPAYHLDAQGRAKPSLCRLYDWRYKKLGNLPHTMRDAEYLLANPGFAFDTQLVNVEDFNGVGETEPSPYFYQNLAEAEFVVATFTYMRLLGYPAEKITVLTTYNGQKHLIRDVIRRRCGENPLIGWPSKVTTVDRFQGQQNDYVLLSLVKTRNIGHVRDVRRLVVAMSRARLGLYIFARVSLFGRCFELTPVFKLLRNTPVLLHLYPQEKFPGVRPINTQPLGVVPYVIQDMPHMSNFVYQFYQERLKQIQAIPPAPTPTPTLSTGEEATITLSEKGTNSELVVETKESVSENGDAMDDGSKKVGAGEGTQSNPFATGVSTSIILEAPQSDIVESDTSSSSSEED